MLLGNWLRNLILFFGLLCPLIVHIGRSIELLAHRGDCRVSRTSHSLHLHHHLLLRLFLLLLQQLVLLHQLFLKLLDPTAHDLILGRILLHLQVLLRLSHVVFCRHLIRQSLLDDFIGSCLSFLCLVSLLFQFVCLIDSFLGLCFDLIELIFELLGFLLHFNISRFIFLLLHCQLLLKLLNLVT